MNITNTKFEIMDSLERLLRNHEYDDISVAMLVEESGVRRQAFYKYYSSKDDLCTQMFEYLCRQCVIMDHSFCISEFVLNFITKAEEHKTFFRFLAKGEKETAMLMVTQEVVNKCITAMVDDVWEDPLDSRILALIRAYSLGCAGLIEEVFLNDGAMTPAEIVLLFQDAMPLPLRETLVNRRWATEVLAPVEADLHSVVGREKDRALL